MPDYPKIATQYAEDIVSGKIKACQYMIFACQRHLDDLARAGTKDFPYIFNDKAINRRCAFSRKFRHVKGKWSGSLIETEPWQIFIEASIWGWTHKDTGLRRFRIAYCEIPRKNGKSIIGAISGNYMHAADNEAGSEVYSGATSEKQAQEVFRPAWQMVQKNPDYQEYFGVSLSGTPRNPTSIYRLDDMSRFEPLIGKPGEGASPHCAIIDEYHEHRTSAQYDSMETGMGAREQPLMLVITTAGVDTSGPCYDMHLDAVKVLDGSLKDDAFFAVIYTIDPKADWKDFKNWEAANPNYGVSIIEDYLQRKYKQTMENAAKQNINLCKHLNVWTNAGVAWMNMAKWAACEDKTLKLEDFRGQSCFMGLDLASKIDICALILLFVSERGYEAFGRYYLPEETVQLSGNDHYDKWVKQGWIISTPGARTDFAYIENDIKAINSINPIIELAFDPRESGYLINNIMNSAWLNPECCIEISQGPALMSQPMKELEALIYAQRLFHNGDPVLTWMIANIIKKQGRTTGPVKYYYPTKAKEENKIDGGVALIMALSRAMLKTESVYEERGLLVL